MGNTYTNEDCKRKSYTLFLNDNIINQSGDLEYLEKVMNDKIEELCVNEINDYKTFLKLDEANTVNIIGYFKNAIPSYEKTLYTLKIV